MRIDIRNLGKTYGKVTALKDINMELKSGIYGLLGPNGAGKSTLMRTILSLQKPVSGKIEYKNGLKSTEIGYIPQQTDAQKDFPASVYEIVLSGFLGGIGFHPFYSKKEKEQAARNMEILGISKLKNRCFRELSGGQKQRVLLARALSATKKMLLLDEPVAGLDPVVTKELYEIIEKLNKQLGITIIMISHDIPAALKYSSHILYVAKPCFFGTKEQFLDSAYASKYIAADGERIENA